MANYPAPYQGNWGYGTAQQVYPQSYMQGQPGFSGQAQGMHGLVWVDGEVGAKAYQMPQGWPNGQPIALWDTNDTVIYLKSTNPMGMPNPLQKARYRLEGTKSGEAQQAFTGDGDTGRYVTKDDLSRMKQELMEALEGLNGSSAPVPKRAAKGEQA